MGTSLLFRSSIGCVRIRPAIDSGASLFVDGLPRSVSTAPATDWTFPLVRPCGGDKPWIRFGLSPLVGIIPS